MTRTELLTSTRVTPPPRVDPIHRPYAEVWQGSNLVAVIELDSQGRGTISGIPMTCNLTIRCYNLPMEYTP